MRNVIYLILLITVFSCSKKQELPNDENNINSTVFFDPILLGATGINASLKINSRFSECGEWGGHNEKIKVYSKERNYKDYFLDYEKTKIDCDKRDKNGENIETVIFQKTIKLDDSGKKSITDYIKRMITSKVEERFPGNAGNSFTVINCDSTLVIKVYDSNSRNLKSYTTLLEELDLKNVK
ncbi:hypothetical protein SAMN05444397_10176 [Flavobacterium aquidurense]|uniref:hypothetical protein n=1 Tax=Flavobacterium frigidimaris TaxID=262320 RepID=UPI00089A3A08|nr:hypothetical protein [Flavobacterium frigidimaris]SDY21917.1 hypothetical protein SAMN05444397_10176 [Flavobacterium aquidurense]